jgi:hypothetical protein
VYEAALVFGFVVLTLAGAWTIYKAVRFALRGEMKETIPYLFAFAVIMYFLIELMPS